MEIEFTEFQTKVCGQLFFATEKEKNDIYQSDVRKNYELTLPMLYIISVCEEAKNPGFIDIGANIGTFTIPVAKAGFQTLAIEALPRNFTLLSQAIYKNALRNVIAVHAAVSDSTGVLGITGESAWARIDKYSNNGIEVPACTLDTLTQIYDFCAATIIKMDVEGAEMAVLAGMERMLAMNPDVEFIFESNAYTCALFEYSFVKLKLFFENKGYNLYCFNKDSLSPCTALSFQESITQDYLATKKELVSCERFTIRSQTTEELINTMLAHCEHSIVHSAYFVQSIKNVPDEIRQDERIKLKLDEFMANTSQEWQNLNHFFQKVAWDFFSEEKMMNENPLEKWSINYIGYLTAPAGLGAGARRYLNALWHQGCRNINCVDVTYTTGHKQSESLTHFTLGEMKPANMNIWHINAYDLPRVMSSVGEKYYENTFNIGVWAWETQELPEEWFDRFNLLNEIWALSNFTANAIARYTKLPVLTMPYIVNHLQIQSDRRQFGLSNDEYIFLFNFDYESVQYRKNPLAVIEAFSLAFREEDSVRLVIKTSNHHLPQHQSILEQLNKATSHLRITFINEILSTALQSKLIGSCDCYISLHRAEGFGLGMAEAMALGKLVIATGWSGNLDFMNVTNSLLVRYELKTLDTDISLYKAGTVWAEPDIAHAASFMREAWARPENFNCLKEKAAKDIKAYLNTEVIGKKLVERLHLISQGLVNSDIMTQSIIEEKNIDSEPFRIGLISPALSVRENKWILLKITKQAWHFVVRITPKKFHPLLFRVVNKTLAAKPIKMLKSSG